MSGTAVALILTTMMAYVISRKEFPGRRALNFFVFFTMLFSGGLVPTYLNYSQLGVRNTIFGLVLPGILMKAFYVLLMKSYFVTNIPESLMESAKIDGTGTFKSFTQVALPLSQPILATIGLFICIDYWNDWYNGLIYLTDKNLFNINNMLNRILLSIQYLQTTADSEAAMALGSIPSTAVRMALAVVGVLPILIVYPFFQKYFVKGITIGAVKG
ncbi:MAG: carbohydrate ABC transporter permease [Parasporobacterium sp.]|nr:carbohydrate ABC transporter permease [Parasporobacterium sp.]